MKTNPQFEIARLTADLKRCAEQRKQFRLERDAARKVAIEAIDTLSTIAAQDPKDALDKPTKLGCVCLLAKTTLRQLGSESSA